MSEIAWLVKLMTSFSLTEEVKSFCLERIGEVEKNSLRSDRHPGYMSVPLPMTNPIIGPPAIGQPPISAAQLKDMQTHPIAPSGQHTTPPTGMQTLRAQAEVITSQTHGGSTRGPNKMRGRL